MSEKKATDYESSRILWRRKLTLIYVSGLGALAVIYLGWSVLEQFSPWFEQFENPLAATAVSFAILLLLPPFLGVLIHYAVNPILGRWGTWNELVRLEEQLVDGISDELEVKVVLVDWPSAQVRSVGMMTKRFPATKDLPEMASVFIPVGARGKSGYMRVVAVEDLIELEWTFREFQVYQLTLGAISPDHLLQD